MGMYYAMSVCLSVYVYRVLCILKASINLLVIWSWCGYQVLLLRCTNYIYQTICDPLIINFKETFVLGGKHTHGL